jgi:two-component system CheB/CheR fusion protein
MPPDEPEEAQGVAIAPGGDQPLLAAADVQHRVRNFLAVIRSIARRTAETSRTVEEYAMNFEGRLNAYARTLSLLSGGTGVDLEYLLAEELLAAQAHDGGQAHISGPAMQLQSRAAEIVGLAFHELTTNAIRHGSLGQANGTVSVSWEVAADRLVLDWVESGSRRLMLIPTRRGFGMQMLEETLAFDLAVKAELHFEGAGFRCRLSFPLTDQVFVLSANH